MAFDKDIPTAATKLILSNPQLLANQAAIQAALDQDHEFTNASGAAQTGKHKTIVLKEQSAPGASASNEAHLYAQDGGTQPELRFVSEDGTAIQMTNSGKQYLNTAYVNGALATKTTDTADNLNVALCGGGSASSTRGGYVNLYGNQHTTASERGKVEITSGYSTEASVRANIVLNGPVSAASTVAVTGAVTASSTLAVTGAITASSTLAVTGATTLTGAVTPTGGIVTPIVTVGGSTANTAVFTKYLIGTLAAGASANIAHGITTGGTKIMHVSASIYSDGESAYMVNAAPASTGADGFALEFDDTNIKFVSIGANLQENAYKIKIDYIA